MYLEIVTPEENLFSGEIDLVQLPGVEGSFELMKNHAPIISALKKGKIKVKADDKISTFDIDGGIIECHDDNVIVLVGS